MGSERQALSAPAEAAEVSRARTHLRRRVALALVAGGLGLVGAGSAIVALGEGDATPGRALSRAGDALGLVIDPEGVLVSGDGGPLRARPVLFRAAEAEGAPADLYTADVRFGAGDGVVLDVRDLTNLTRSSGADEGAPVPFGAQRAAYLTRVRDAVTGLVLLDLRGERASATEGWSTREQLRSRPRRLPPTRGSSPRPRRRAARAG